MSLPQNYNLARIEQIICIIENIALIPSKEDRQSTVLMFVGSTFDLMVGEDRSQVDDDLYPTFRNAAVSLTHAKAAMAIMHDAERESELWLHDQIKHLKQRIDENTRTLRDVLKRLCYHRFGVQSQPA